jgi:hypothetical protein
LRTSSRPTKGGPFGDLRATRCKNYVMHPTVTVDISRVDNPGILFERQVFGVRFDELDPIHPSEHRKN